MQGDLTTQKHGDLQIGDTTNPKQMMALMLENLEFVRSVKGTLLVENKDYGKVPRISKPFLWKAGAEKLLMLFGCNAKFEYTITELSNNHREYRYHCNVYRVKDDKWLGEGFGTCNTLEDKFLYKKSNPYQLFNTAMQTSLKRAMVSATVRIFGLSGEFTQDEDWQGSTTNEPQQPQQPQQQYRQPQSQPQPAQQPMTEDQARKILFKAIQNETKWNEWDDERKAYFKQSVTDSIITVTKQVDIGTAILDYITTHTPEQVISNLLEIEKNLDDYINSVIDNEPSAEEQKSPIPATLSTAKEEIDKFLSEQHTITEAQREMFVDYLNRLRNDAECATLDEFRDKIILNSGQLEWEDILNKCALDATDSTYATPDSETE